MKVFNGKAAMEEYMSTHSLTYSTPETILRKFAYWLGDLVDIDCKLDKCPNEDGLHPKHRMPRLMLFIEEKDIPYTLKEEEEFVPTGVMKNISPRLHEFLPKQAPKIEANTKFCAECGKELSLNAKFCPQCGTKS